MNGGVTEELEPRTSRSRDWPEASESILGRVAGIWRYPIMGMQGEILDVGEVSKQGVVGDHVYVVRDGWTGNILGPKNYGYSWGETSALPNLIEFKAELVSGAEAKDQLRITFADGEERTGKADELSRPLSGALSRKVELVKYPKVAESRALSGRALHLLTTSSLEAMEGFYPSGEFDFRRFRPNIFLESGFGEGFVEESWVGLELAVGAVRLKVEKPNVRCVVTTLRQGSLKEDPEILNSIEKYNGKRLGVMCSVAGPGMVRVGDEAARV